MIFVQDPKGLLMQFINFIGKFLAVEHPHKGGALKLNFYE